MLKKTCTKCKQEKPVEAFQEDTRIKSGYTARCQECSRETVVEWRRSNPGKIALYRKRWKVKNPDKLRAARQRYFLKYKDKIYAKHRRDEFKVKTDALTYYGDGKLACVKCGFTDIRALSIDHIEGNGARHRKEVGMRQAYYWLRTHGYPVGYQTLCMNCQWIKRNEMQELSRPHILTGLLKK